MNKIITVFVLILLSVQSISSQTKISGKVTDQKKQTIPGANILIKGSYDGISSSVDGSYSFTANDTGEATIAVSFIGYETLEKKVRLTGKDIVFNPVLKEAFNELKVVTISAGTIEASDERRTTVLKPLDIVTTAGGLGDINGALKTLPGAQQVGESAELFVRGGTGAETKTIIDGMVVNNPFYSANPDIASRGRFSPFIFKGTVFSTGGYSAQYGQAMSSVLALETNDLPDRTSSTVAISSVGVGVGHNHLWKEKNMSAGADINYTNLTPYFNIVKQAPEYTAQPQFSGGSVNFRKKTSPSGIIKFYGYFNLSNFGFKTPSLDSTNGYKNLFELANTNVYTNLTYKERLGEKWVLNVGASYSTNVDKINLSFDTIRSQSDLSQGRVMVSRGIGKMSIIRAGAEYQYSFEGFNIKGTSYGYHFENRTNVYDNYSAEFVEADVFLSQKLVMRLGGRGEYSTIMNKYVTAPRASVSYKTGDYSTVSFAYGQFYQKPEHNFLLNPQIPGYNKATHYIANIQKVDDFHTLRLEIYYKKYDNLTLYNPDSAATLTRTVSNNGYGYAQGLDLFWRDKKTFNGVDYWISYTYLDTKRLYLYYPKEVTPPFAATHTATLVFKKFFVKQNLSTGFTYTYASGRPYNNPRNTPSEFMSQSTIDYNSLGVNCAFLKQIKKCFAVLAFAVTNVFGQDQVFGYRYSYDLQRSQAITPPAKRFFFVGLFLSFGTDRSKDVINNNN